METTITKPEDINKHITNRTSLVEIKLQKLNNFILNILLF